MKTPNKESNLAISTVILCGGRGSRLGNRNKPLLSWKGKPLIEHVTASLPQSRHRFVSANRDSCAYSKYGKVIKDSDTGLISNSPLVGILCALTHMTTEWLLVAPGDTPLLKRGWESPLVAAISNSSILYARDSERTQPLHQLIHMSETHYLRQYLLKGNKSVTAFLKSRQAKVIPYAYNQMFKNFNSPEDFI